MSRASLTAFAGAFLLALVGSGCSPVGPNGAPAGSSAYRAIEPDLDVTTPLALPRLRRQQLKVGDDAATAAEIFPKPPRAFVFNELPERLQGDFDARGWEAKDEGFGAILYGGRVAAAMRQFYGIDAARYDDLLQTVRAVNEGVKSRTLTGENVEFTFWEAEPQVLMVLRRGVRQDTFDVTMALGDRQVMDVLDATPAKAQGILDRLEGNAISATPNKPPVKAPTPRDQVPTQEHGR